MPQPYRTELMPGVWLTAIQTSKFKSSYWSLQLIVPLERQYASLHAALPRVLRRGTASCPDQQKLNERLDSLYGGVIESTAGKRGEAQCAGFVASFLDDALTPDGKPILRQAAQLLGELLLHPATRNGRLLQAYVDSERENLIREIHSQRNHKQSYAVMRMVEQMCKGEPFRIGRLGDLRSAERVTLIRLNRYYQDVLAKAHIEVYYCGSAAPEQAEQAWKEALMGLPRSGEGALPDTASACPPINDVRRCTEQMDVNQGKLVMGFRTGVTMSAEGYHALLVMNALYGGTPNSKLFLNVRERQSLCYYAQSSVDGHKGLLYVQSGVDFSDMQRAEEEILAQLEAVRQGEFTDEELAAAQRSIARGRLSLSDAQSQQADYWLGQAVEDQVLTPEQSAALAMNVSREQVCAAAQRVRLDTVYCLTGRTGKEGA